MNDAARPAIRVGPIHYQILGGAGLLLMFLAQLDQGIYLGGLLVACIGLFGIVSKWRAAPLILLGAFAAAQVGQHIMVYRDFATEDRRPLLHLRDLASAIGLVAYIAANCRLQSLWSQIVPADPRQRERKRHRAGRRVGYAEAPVPQKRASRLLTPQEIAAFVLMLPFWALLGQALWVFIAQPWPSAFSVFESPRALRLLSFAWLLIMGLLIAGTVLGQWRRRQMDRAAAQICLQDILWRETRREQRRIFRWLAWRKVHELTESGRERYQLEFQSGAMSIIWIFLGTITATFGADRILYSIRLLAGEVSFDRLAVATVQFVAAVACFGLAAFFFARAFRRRLVK
jgi:hypothetical protein